MAARGEIYIQYVWATHGRAPLIAPALERPLFSAILAKCHALRCTPIAVGGTEDHVHLLVRLHRAVAPSRLIGEVKGASSHLVTHVVAAGAWFAWQPGYGAFSIARDDIASVARYVSEQRRRHDTHGLLADLERIDDAND